jgi:hypothetical protein
VRTKSEILVAVANLREQSTKVRDRLEYAEGQAYYDKLDSLTEINTHIKNLLNELKGAPDVH